jgi:hypothetical protein
VTDHALVVGVARYPGLAVRGVSADLEGPDNDAGAIRDWLVDPAGGGLDPVNVTLIRSGDFTGDAADPEPAAARIERELARLEERTRDSPGGRLYLYFSGHGFAPVLEEGALFTAEATHIRPSYVYAHAWLRWFRRAGRFREFVLLMDCCMSYRVSIPVNEVLMGVEIATGVPGPAFIGVAAQSKEALEHRAPDGTVHGVFTWALLAGLRGGAADERGRVTGASLKTFLHNALPEFLPAEVRRAGAVDLRPFVRADDGVVLRRFPAQPTHRVTLRAPQAAAGDQLMIWTGRPHAAVVTQPLGPDAAWTGDLVRGLYVAEVPAAGLRQGVAVTGAGDVDVELVTAGPPVVAPAAASFAFEVVADNPAAAITVTDHRFELAYSDTGQLRERDLPGVYRVRAELGRDIGSVAEKIVLLDRDLVGHRIAAPPVPSPAPSAAGGEAAGGEAAGDEAAGGDHRPTAAAWGAAPDGAGIRVTLGAPGRQAGLDLFTPAGERVAQVGGPDPAECPLPPGTYHLRQTQPDGTAVELAVVVCTGWWTEVALRCAPDGQLDDAAVFMRPAGGGPAAANQDAVIEAARIALAQGRNLFEGGRGVRARRLLLAEYLDPVAGIIGAHLLIRAGGAAGGPAAGTALDAVVRRLRGFVGWNHPDVEALSLRCADPGLHTTEPLTTAPMFRASWDLLVAASYDRPGLVPATLWARVRAGSDVGALFAWAADDATRAAHASLLGDWTTRVAGDADAARRAGIPAGAFSGAPSPREAAPLTPG